MHLPPVEPPPRPTVTVAPLTSGEAAAIRDWPPYTGEYAPLDYALRMPGWLGLFPASSTTHHLALRAGSVLVGFSLLVNIQDRRAEFYIAIHPDWLGHGIGQAATCAVLRHGFETLHLAAIYLKVRSWHQRGIHIYRKAGFIPQGEKREEIQGVLERFIVMEVSSETFRSQPGR